MNEDDIKGIKIVMLLIFFAPFILSVGHRIYLDETAMDYETAVEKKNGAGSDFMNGFFTVVVQWGGDHVRYDAYKIVYANDTKMMYFVYDSGALLRKSYVVTPLYDENGEPQVYNEAVKSGKDTGFYQSLVHAIEDCKEQ